MMLHAAEKSSGDLRLGRSKREQKSLLCPNTTSLPSEEERSMLPPDPLSIRFVSLVEAINGVFSFGFFVGSHYENSKIISSRQVSPVNQIGTSNQPRKQLRSHREKGTSSKDPAVVQLGRASSLDVTRLFALVADTLLRWFGWTIARQVADFTA